MSGTRANKRRTAMDVEPPSVDIVALFSVLFPGKQYTQDATCRLADRLRSVAEGLQTDDQGAARDGAEHANGSAASPPAQEGNAPPAAKPFRTKKQRLGKGQRAFDFSAFQTRYVALEVAYLGADHQGFAAQAHTENTIEGHLFAALRRLRLIPEDADWQQLRYSRCGRTDKGVSALGQVVALDLRSKAKVGEPQPHWQQEQDYPGCLNRVLPDSIRVLGWTDAPEGFHARFGAAYREYKYFIVQREGELDIAAMRRAASYMLGPHDFRNFCKMDVVNVHNFERTILDFRIEPCEAATGATGGRQVYELCIRGTAFLWHQVRCMAAVLLMVGRGQEQPEVVQLLLNTARMPAKPNYQMAPEEPLLLSACEFKQPLAFHRSRASATAVRHLLAATLDQAAVHTAMLATIQARLQSGGVDPPLPAKGGSAAETTVAAGNVESRQKGSQPAAENGGGQSTSNGEAGAGSCWPADAAAAADAVMHDAAQPPDSAAQSAAVRTTLEAAAPGSGESGDACDSHAAAATAATLSWHAGAAADVTSSRSNADARGAAHRQTPWQPPPPFQAPHIPLAKRGREPSEQERLAMRGITQEMIHEKQTAYLRR